jgi:hypothetical protein
MLPHMEALGAGAAGPGKSMVLLMDPMTQIAVEHQRCADPAHPYHQKWGDSQGWALHLRRTSPMLDETIARSLKIFPQVDPNAEWRQTNLEWIFTSGYRYKFGHCKDPDDWMAFQSKQFTEILYDELVQFTEEQYDQINTRLRCSDPVLGGSRELGLPGMLRIRSMSNPVMQSEHMEGVAAHDRLWVRRRFVDPDPNGKHTFYRTVEVDGVSERWDWIYLPAKLTDNPDRNFVRNYTKNLQSAKPHIRAALLDGNWYVTANSYFGDVWNERIHLAKPFRLPADWPVFRSMDWGYKSFGCCHWWTMDPDENLFCMREYTFRGKTAREVAVRIREIEEDMKLWDKRKRRSGIHGVADTQLWEKRGEGGKSKAEEMQEEGVIWYPADKRSRDRNYERIHGRLGDAPAGETPGLVIFSTCHDLIRTLPALQTDQGNPESPMDGGEDHWLDSASYACAYASHGRSGLGRRKQEDEYDDEPKVERARRGRWGYGQTLA